MLTDVLIPLRTQPEADEPETVGMLLRLATSFATHVTLSPLEALAPDLRHRWSGAFLGLAGAGAEIERVSREASARLLASATGQPGLQVTGRPLQTVFGGAPVSLTSAARHHDLTMIAFTDPEACSALAEAVVFGTGRPTMLVPASISEGARLFSKIAVAWDGSETASRALHDAMPLVRHADEVIIMHAPADKLVDAGEIAGITDYLIRHGIAAKVVEADTEILDIGLALQHTARLHGAGLLVMGAFGHSRLQQFILGGATRGVLRNLQLPVLMSH